MIQDEVIYLDNAATVRAFDSVINYASKIESEFFFNSEALYEPSRLVRESIEEVRKLVAQTIGAQSEEIFFVGSATEANNWAIKSGAKNKKGTIVTSLMEHPSVFNTVQFEKSKVLLVNIISGKVDLEHLKTLLNAETTLVSITHVCGQTGAINDIKAIAKLTRQLAPNALIHSDGVQAWLKCKFDIKDLDVDLYTMSAHKIGGLKGLGILYIKKDLFLSPLLVGGNQEGLRRAGTVNNAAVLSLNYAINDYLALPTEHYVTLHNMAVFMLKRPDVLILNSDTHQIFTACFAGIQAEILQRLLSDSGVLVGIGSACSSKDRVNRLLKAMRVEDKYVNGAIRLSFGPYNNLEQIITACDLINATIDRIKNMERI
ncbi:MAG: aminotransferase class V-fold PLP-dependent enzyme [Clostridiales bacterium]|jgi:cysteine desulfurase|nr:aminotransferase class V-fold PLP-dependent enzyme [Clostridiales bacterium]